MPIIRGEITETVDITTNGTHNVAQYTSANVAVSPSISSLNVTPTTSAQQITAPQGTDGYSPINVSAVTSSIDANITAGNIKNGVTILGVTGSYQGSGGDVMQLMWQEYGIATELWESVPARFDFEDSAEQDPIDFTAWENAGLDFWEWFKQTNGFREIRFTKALSVECDDDEWYYYILEIAAGTTEFDPDESADIFQAVWTARGGDLWTAGYLAGFDKNGYNITDPQTYEQRQITYKSAPNAQAYQRDLIFCFDDMDVAISSHA